MRALVRFCSVKEMIGVDATEQIVERGREIAAPKDSMTASPSSSQTLARPAFRPVRRSSSGARTRGATSRTNVR